MLPGDIAQYTLHEMNRSSTSILTQSSTGSTSTAPSIAHQGEDDKYATDKMKPRKIRTRDNITIATWNMRTLSQTGKLQKLTHELERYNWHIVGFCEVLWEDLGEHLSDKGDILYYSGDMSSHVHGIGFLVNKNAKNSVPGCPPISKRIITIHLRAAPFNITVVQAYGPTTEYDNEQVEEFYSQLQDSFDKVEKKDLLIIQGDWNAKVREDAMKNEELLWNFL